MNKKLVFPKLSLLAVLIPAFLGQSVSAYAVSSQELPTGGQITAGSGSISQSGGTMTVNQTSNQMVTNWNTFNIGNQATVNFNQPSSSSVALNRVMSANPSYIFGNLNANGQVFLLNPSGVIFGAGSSVNVGGLVASSLSLSDADFLSGNYHFTNGAGAGSILNQGNINGLVVALIAPQVTNAGTITTPGGTTALAAGDDVSLDFTGDGLLNVNVNTADINALVTNHSLIEANGGKVIMTAQAAGDLMATVVNNDGIIQAQGLSTGQNGEIYLDGGSQGITRAAGTLDVSNAYGNGGQIIVIGDKVLVDQGANLDATGTTGGGDIDVGGSWEASNPNIAEANATYVDPTAILNASATDNGNGGTVVVRSNLENTNGATWAEGTFLANGGPNGGNGGNIETSGHWLDTSLAQISASSVNGNPGQWLLDPYDVTITPSTTATDTFSSGTWTPSATDSEVSAATIASELEGGTSVTVTTYDGGSGSDIGDLTDNATINMSSGSSNVSLTLAAADTIKINDPIEDTSSGGGQLTVTLDADNDGGTADGVGIIFLNSNITTNGGNINFGTGRTYNGILDGGDTYVGGSGASAISLTTNGGNVNVEGQMLIADTNGLTIDTHSSSGGGNVNFYGLVDSGNTYAFASDPSVTWTSAVTAAQGATNGYSVNATYLATPNTKLDNAVAGYVASYQPSWLGAERVTAEGTDNIWRWVTGPLGQEEVDEQLLGINDSNKGLPFFTQNGSDTANGSGGTAINGAYTNWNGGEPNNFGGANLSQSGAVEYVMEFVNNNGVWNDYAPTNTSGIEGYVQETNIGNSPLTINAGSTGLGKVTFSSAVGSADPLASLTVTANNGIAINGGSVTTTGLQTYNNNVTLGASSTTLTQTNAAKDFTLPSSVSITNAYGANASLDIVTTEDILLDSNSSISSSTGGLSVTLNSDSGGSGGAIVMDAGSGISTNGGSIIMGGSSSPSSDDALGRSSVANSSNGIYMYDSSLISAGGNITMNGEGAATGAADTSGSTTSFGINLEDSTGNNTLINSGSGTITMNGTSVRTSAGDGHGIQIGSGAGTTKIESSSTSSSAITITGTGSTTSVAATNNSGVFNLGTIETTNGGGIGITGTGGPSNTGFTVGVYSKGNILSNSGAITIEGTGGSGGTDTQDIYFDSGAYTGYKTGTDVTSSSSNITLEDNTLNVASTSFLQSSGILTVEPRSSTTTIGISGGSGTLSLPANYFSTNFVNGFSQLDIGNSTAGNLTLGGSTTFNDNIDLISGGNINLNAAVNASGQNVTLTAGSGKTVSGSGNITGSGLLLNGSGATYTLNTASNNSVGTIASTGSTAINFINNGNLAVGTVGATNGVTATGNITLQTSGNLTLNKPVTTGSGTIILAAGGNFDNTNASNTGLVPGSGRYLVYSTNPADDTRGMTSFNKHYDQSYTAGVTPSYASSGNWFFYSLDPVITATFTPVSESLNYGQSAPTYTVSLSGFIDGDTSSVLSDSTITISGQTDSSGNYLAGDHELTYSAANSLGYSIVTFPDTLTINPPLNTSSIESAQSGITGTSANNSAINSQAANNAITPGSGATSLMAPQTLITEPMTLTTGGFTQPINLTTNGATLTLNMGSGTGTMPTSQSGIAVFVSNSGTVVPQQDYNLTDTGSSLSMTQSGQNTTSIPNLNGNYVQTGNFSVNMPNGSTVQLTVSLTNAGVLVINVPPGTMNLDIQSLIIIGLASAKQKLHLSLNSIKSVVVVQ